MQTTQFLLFSKNLHLYVNLLSNRSIDYFLSLTDDKTYDLNYVTLYKPLKQLINFSKYINLNNRLNLNKMNNLHD